MSHPSKPAQQSVLPAQVWNCLSAEHRAKVIQFMAQLAVNLLKTQIDFSSEEATYVNRSNAQQDSSGPS